MASVFKNILIKLMLVCSAASMINLKKVLSLSWQLLSLVTAYPNYFSMESHLMPHNKLENGSFYVLCFRELPCFYFFMLLLSCTFEFLPINLALQLNKTPLQSRWLIGSLLILLNRPSSLQASIFISSLTCQVYLVLFRGQIYLYPASELRFLVYFVENNF